MQNYSRILGDAVKRARGRHGLTQSEVAEAANVDVRTILNIENYRGNPKMEVLYPLIRVLNIDPREIFNPETQRDSTSLQQFRLFVEMCSEDEAALMIPIFNAVLNSIRSAQSLPVNRNIPTVSNKEEPAHQP